MKILFSAPVPVDVLKEYRADFELCIPDKKLSYQETLDLASDCDAYMILANKGDKALLDAAVKLKAIANFGVGYDNIDWQYATEKGIAVINTPTQVTDSTAEHTVALLVDTMRGISRYDREVRQHIWNAPLFSDRNTAISGSVLGIVGFGRIGKLVCRKAQGLGMKVIYYDKFRATPEVEKEYDVMYMSFDNLVKEADCITLHVPYIPENHHLFNAERFRAMKKSAYLVNCSRGPVVDEYALSDALKNHVIKGAGLDVFENEPNPIPELLGLDNVVLTPHAASCTMKARIGMLREAVAGIVGVLNGEIPYNVINPKCYTGRRPEHESVPHRNNYICGASGLPHREAECTACAFTIHRRSCGRYINGLRSNDNNLIIHKRLRKYSCRNRMHNNFRLNNC